MKRLLHVLGTLLVAAIFVGAAYLLIRASIRGTIPWATSAAWPCD